MEAWKNATLAPVILLERLRCGSFLNILSGSRFPRPNGLASTGLPASDSKTPLQQFLEQFFLGRSHHFGELFRALSHQLLQPGNPSQGIGRWMFANLGHQLQCRVQIRDGAITAERLFDLTSLPVTFSRAAEIPKPSWHTASSWGWRSARAPRASNAGADCLSLMSSCMARCSNRAVRATRSGMPSTS